MLLLRNFTFSPVKATHLRIVARNSQCTGGPAYQGEQDADPNNATIASAGRRRDGHAHALVGTEARAPDRERLEARRSQPGVVVRSRGEGDERDEDGHRHGHLVPHGRIASDRSCPLSTWSRAV